MSLELCDVRLDLRRGLARGRGRPLLDGLSLRVAPGEVVAAAGPPGFGGTSLSRLVAGIVVPESGQVRIGGTDVTGLLPARRAAGLVPVGGGLLPHLTTEANITYGLLL